MSDVNFLQPADWRAALEARASSPDAVVVAGGTDVLVELNFDRLHPMELIDLERVEGIRSWSHDDATVRIAAGVTYSDLVEHLSGALPALAQAARSVGSPPIRNRGTIGGNLASASPAGDCHPPLFASGAQVELSSSTSTRSVAIADFFTGPKRSVLRGDELITAISAPVATGPQAFSKIGVRNAMVIALCSFALALDPPGGRVGTGIGSAGPVPLRASEAEEFLSGHLAESGSWESRAPLAPSVLERFAELVSDAARPIDDIRASAAYRRHVLGVLARRSLSWCWAQYAERDR